MKIYSQGDQAIIVAIQKDVSKDVTQQLLLLRDYLVKQDLPFIVEIVPTESDMMIVYDARDMIKHHHIESPYQHMKHLIEQISQADLEQTAATQTKQICDIPVVYGGTYGPDLEPLLQEYGLDFETFVNLHTSEAYFVSMMGYSPGFPYLSGLNESLYVNHTSANKKKVPAGSVILEGKKCGIVTTDTYNDWLVIGYTPLQLFYPDQADFTLIKLGDSVTFKAIAEDEIELGAYELCRLKL